MESAESNLRVDQSILEFTQHRHFHHSLFAPCHYEPGYEYPLLVWLHGPGDDERQLCRIMPHLSLRNYVAVGPRGCCPPDPGCLGYRWQQGEHSVQDAADRVFDSIEVACGKYNVAKDRIFLAGYQCGGTLALRIGLKYPEHFAGAMSVDGPFPTGAAPLSRLRQARELPILMAQGRESLTYPPQVANRELRLYHAAAMQVTLRLYPCGDELTTQMLEDVDVWMMERINGVSESSDQDVYVYPGESN